MRVDIRTAALGDDLYQRARQAAMRLRVFQVNARIGDWDGTRCDLLIAAADDAYGFQVLSLAVRRGMPVIAIGEPIDPIDLQPLAANVSPAALAITMRAALGLAAQAPKQASQGASRDSVICRLADPGLRGKAVDISRHGRTIMLRPAAGRVYAASHSDLLAGLEGFRQSGWAITPAESGSGIPDAASRSLESFLLRAAYDGKAGLPSFPDGRYRLEAWPDLGALPSLLCALHVAKVLVSGIASPQELAESKHRSTEPSKVNACLWAFAAANLLIDASADKRAQTVRPETETRRVKRGVWAGIARRFGLLAQ